MIYARKTGRCANGAERDAGAVSHVLPLERFDDCLAKRALCGTQPGRLSGWSEVPKDKPGVICKGCALRAQAREMKCIQAEEGIR